MNKLTYNIFQLLIKITRNQAKKYPKGDMKRLHLMCKVQELGKYIYFRKYNKPNHDRKYDTNCIKFLKYVYGN